MKILHLLYAGGTGGIEKLCKDIGLYSKDVENHFLFAHTGGKLYEEMSGAHLPVYLYSYGNKDIVPFRKELRRLCEKLKVDAVLIHHPAPLFWLACMPLIKSMKQTAFLVYAHNNYEELTGKKAWKRLLYNRLLKKAAGVVAISEFVKASVIKGSKVNPQKVNVVYNGVHVEDYAGVNSIRPKGSLRLLYVGRLIEKKGVQVLLEAMNRLKGQEEITLSVVGDGSYRKTLETYVKDKGLEKTVTFYGEQRDVPAFMQSSDVFVHPAIWEEGFGITLIEAMSAGLICVAFNRGALNEIIVNGTTGYLVEEVDADKLSQTILMLLDMTDERFMEMKAMARKRACGFSIETLLEQLKLTVKECMDGR